MYTTILLCCYRYRKKENGEKNAVLVILIVPVCMDDNFIICSSVGSLGGRLMTTVGAKKFQVCTTHCPSFSFLVFVIGWQFCGSLILVYYASQKNINDCNILYTRNFGI